MKQTEQQIELELSPGILAWVLEQYSPAQKGEPGKYKWYLVGKKVSDNKNIQGKG